MKEALRNIKECVLYKDNGNDKQDRLNKLDNIQKKFYSEFESFYFNANSFDLIDEISIMIFGKRSNEKDDSFSTHQIRRKQENKIVDKFNKLHNSILSILVEESNIVFVTELIFFKLQLLLIPLYCLLVIALTLNNSSVIILIIALSLSDLSAFSKNSRNLSHRRSGWTSVI